MHNRRMRHRLVLLASSLLLAGAALAAAPAPVTVQERVLVLPKLPAGADTPMNLPEEGAVKLPFVSGGAPGVAQRINTAVWREMLDGAAAPTTPGKTWTPPADKLPQGTSSLKYSARLLPPANPRMLALAFSGEGCGAYCEGFDTTRLFDLRDGRVVSLGDLLNVDGFAAAGRRLDAQRRRAYQKQVRELAAAKKSARKGSQDDEDDTDQRLTFNRDCLKQVDTQPSTPWWLVGEGFAVDDKGGLSLTKGRCSNHAMQALDDVGDITVTLPAAELQPWLTPYGLAVMRQQGDAPPPAAFDQRELHGQMGGMAITMRLEPLRDGVDTRGSYVYDKYRTPIALVVRRDGDSQIRATEQTASQGRFDLTIAGGTLAGTWSDKDRRKELPVILQ